MSPGFPFISLVLTFNLSSLAQPLSGFSEKFNKGKTFLSQNETASALIIFEELYKTEPNNSNVNYLLGICYTEESPSSHQSVLHLEKAIKDVSLSYDGSSFAEKRAPIFVYYYLVIAYSQNGKCKEARQAKNYFHSLYGMEKHDYYITDAENWVNKCSQKQTAGGNSETAGKPASEPAAVITKTIDYTTDAPLYGIQVGAFSRFVPVYEFTGLKNVEAFIDNNGLVRYVIGNFGLKLLAENLLRTVQEAGYQDAFIVDVNKEKKFSEELVIVNNSSIYKNSMEKVSFKIQIGAFRESIPSHIAKIYLTLDGIEEKTENGFAVLSVGNFTAYEEAENYKNEIIAAGITDAFIVAYSENKKIDVNQARSFYQLKSKK